ncbi:helix-turn-helix transcriptional regulator [Phytomonospora sp. NPDC050363]|uniref:helix-turn-helix transcriptional regulator n=1 Tax=Phytomonospora sp. NPDC050363 TaxID=3155642 RepID=UPI0033DE9252
MDRRTQLGEFLRSRRARLRPEEFGLSDYGRFRRVPGLRREELARLAGVSVDHYVRLEQGRELHFSDEVLDAVARTLRLTADERAHLYRLARPTASTVPERVQRVRPGLRRLLDNIPDVPAYVIGRGIEILAWNRPAAALIADFGAREAGERNFARMFFLEASFREVFADPSAKADDLVAHLHHDAGGSPGDPELARLVGELSIGSEDFRRRWAEHDVRAKSHGQYRVLHPVVGALDLSYETLRPPDDPEQALVTYTAEPGTPSDAALRVLTALGEAGYVRGAAVPQGREPSATK